jgi:hypothetical protein
MSGHPPFNRGSTPLLTLRTDGFTRAFWIVQAAVAVGFFLGVFVLVFLTPADASGSGLSRLLPFLLFLIAADIGMLEIVEVRAIEIDPDGVTFRYRFHSERGLWSDLSPTRNPIEGGMWTLKRKTPRNVSKPTRAHSVTLRRARAILESPYCPRWDLPRSVAEILRMQQFSPVESGPR